MGDRRRWNRISFKRNNIVDNDGEIIYTIVGFKFKNKKFARPIILTGKMAENWVLDSWREIGWKEGDEW